MTDWLSRIERFDVVSSTNDIVADWLRDGTDEVCVAIADEQLAGRGRNGRTWSAPSGASLLASVGFRPTWLEPPQAWRLGALVSLAMAEAAEATARLPAGTVRLKWPNDLVIVQAKGAALKVAGVLGETEGLGTALAQAVIGIGINVDRARGAHRHVPHPLGAAVRGASCGPLRRGCLARTSVDQWAAGAPGAAGW